MRHRARPLEDDCPSGDPVAVMGALTGLVDRRETPATESRTCDQQRERENTEAPKTEAGERHPDERREQKHEPPTAGRRRQTDRGGREQDVGRASLYACAHAAGR